MPINQSSSGMCFKGQIFSKFLTESQQLACGLRAFLTVRVDHLLCLVSQLRSHGGSRHCCSLKAKYASLT